MVYRLDDYPPEYDGGDLCDVCSGYIGATRRMPYGDECECPECPVCSEVGDMQCYNSGHMDKGNRAFNIADLAAHLSAARDTAASIAKRLFKDTECGISFYVYPGGTRVTVAGYADGSGDAYCEPIVMAFPIDLAEFDKAVERADQEGCDLFDEFHCHICGSETGYEEPCENCDKEEEDE